MSGPVVVLAGGTGGAKLARGMLDVAGSDLVVVANTGDDIEIHGAYVCPECIVDINRSRNQPVASCVEGITQVVSGTRMGDA